VVNLHETAYEVRLFRYQHSEGENTQTGLPYLLIYIVAVTSIYNQPAGLSSIAPLVTTHTWFIIHLDRNFWVGVWDFEKYKIVWFGALARITREEYMSRA